MSHFLLKKIFYFKKSDINLISAVKDVELAHDLKFKKQYKTKNTLNIFINKFLQFCPCGCIKKV